MSILQDAGPGTGNSVIYSASADKRELVGRSESRKIWLGRAAWGMYHCPSWGQMPCLHASACVLSQAQFREALLDSRFHDAASWYSLGVTTHRAWLAHTAQANDEPVRGTLLNGKAVDAKTLHHGWTKAVEYQKERRARIPRNKGGADLWPVCACWGSFA